MTALAQSTPGKSRLLQGVCLVLCTLSLASCTTARSNLTTGSITRSFSKPIEEMNETELRQAEESIGRAYEKSPKDRNAGLNYANLLRMTGKNTQALAVMQQVAINFPTDREVLAAYGKAQASAGQLEQALQTIGRAQTPDRPDWRLESARGAVLDQMGRTEEARLAYRSALDIKPNEPSVLSNLGMSYLLTGDARTAETYLRNAAAQPGADSRVRQNLSLVVGLQGRFEEAEQIAMRELDPQQATANVAYLRSMLTQQNSWSKLAQQDKGGKAASAVN
ncbi:tetratricopeptide repeat protein [Gellertiella hungarica]|uniref:Flp pilus assembly protein TadD n=1 Tax=Gellertiella hungarica TaxID=1572859 RepID=A0A7W6J9Q7_9HYPH|nr:tetratricopeptide repeat protein [Gellertiella hungarica]MBB4066453.1 Flp pilus assembly protein TadD [Gellertiella hungarica]